MKTYQVTITTKNDFGFYAYSVKAVSVEDAIRKANNGLRFEGVTDEVVKIIAKEI